MKFYLLILISIIALSSCEKEIGTGTHKGMAPIYSDIDFNDPKYIKASDPREFGDLGAIVERNQYIYVMEKYKGIHVVNNADPANPVTIKFWEIPGIFLFTLDSEKLYAGNGSNLWVVDITDVNNIKVIDVEKNVFVNQSDMVPDGYFGFFECVDPTKGLVIGWTEKELINPHCRK